jgi:hypothetical protein
MSNLKTALILDSRIENLTDIESFGVKSSAQNNTFQQYASLSASPSLITYQAQIPSESIVCDRSILQACDLCFQVNIDGINNANGSVGQIPAGSDVWQWGLTESFAPFPLTQCFSTIQSSINNCSVSINIGDILPQMLRMTSQRELQKYNSTTPAMVDDLWGMYQDAVKIYNPESGATTVGNQNSSSNSNPLGSSYNSGFDRAYAPRGSFPASCVVLQYAANGTTFVSNSSICATTGNRFKVVIKVSVAEPIMLSPFLNCLPHGNQAGFMGINTLTLNFNVNNLQRVVRTAQNYVNTAGFLVPKYALTVIGGTSVDGAAHDVTVPLFSSARLLCNFLSLNPSQSARVALRNVCEYTDFPRFITSSNNSTRLDPCVYDPDAPFPVPTRNSITSNNIQLNQIPSRFIIVVGEPTGSRNPAYTDSFLTIEGIQINFNNKSGIFASATQYDLYSKIAVPSGSTQTWEEFRGWAVSTEALQGLAVAGDVIPTTYERKNVSTIGSILVINSELLGLPDELAGGSLGQFNLQMNISVANYLPYSVQPQITIIACNEGIFSTIAGSSTIMTGLLTKEMVLSTKEQVPVADSASYERFVGGVLSNSSMANAMRLIGKHYKGLPAVATSGLSAFGSGSSGGGSSGGRLRKHYV